MPVPTSIALLLIVCVIGCSKSSQPASSSEPAPSQEATPAPQAGNAPATPAQVPSAVPARTEADMNAVLAELTQVLRKYSAERRSVPKTFDEVVAAGYVRNMPQAPPGKKFGIDPKTLQVVLVKL